MPDKVVDLKALTGDSSDNIPGVKGVGPKTAINLLKENIDLDAVYATLEAVEAEGPKASRGAIKGALKGKLAQRQGQRLLVPETGGNSGGYSSAGGTPLEPLTGWMPTG